MRLPSCWLPTAAVVAFAPALAAQVTIAPATFVPGQRDRLAVRVATRADSPIVAVRVEVPAALGILGVDAPPGWTARVVAPTDSSPPAIEWHGGRLGHGEFREFAFLAQLGFDARRRTLVFPVETRSADGTIRRWRTGGDGPAPTVQIRGATVVTPGGAFAFAAAAFGLAALALVLALHRRR
jgi:uncharacterized protein YcnI